MIKKASFTTQEVIENLEREMERQKKIIEKRKKEGCKTAEKLNLKEEK